MKRTGMGVILTGCLLAVPGSAAAFTASNGVVTDERTGLVWQQQDDGQTRAWEAAIAYCEGLSLAGQSDWRLPNIKELESITDDTREFGPAIDPVFTGTVSSHYWSSTTDAGGSSLAWNVFFINGEASRLTKSGSFYVRCVRGGQ